MDIQLEHIEFSHGQTPLIQDLCCRFGQGKFHAVLGPNGSGKTTLLDIISGFISPCVGTVRLGKTSISTLGRSHMAQALTRVSQNEAIHFPFRVEEVVMMGRHPYLSRFSHPGPQDHQRVKEAMEKTQTLQFKGRPITELSGGEQQRCIFARALCQDTPILLLDEAFSNMDIRHTLTLLALVKNSVKYSGKTIIAVLHDLNLAASHADEILFLKQGRVLAQGETEKVLTRENLKDVFGIETKVEFNEYVQSRQISYQPV